MCWKSTCLFYLSLTLTSALGSLKQQKSVLAQIVFWVTADSSVWEDRSRLGNHTDILNSSSGTKAPKTIKAPVCCWVNPRDKGIQIIFLAIGIIYYHELRESTTFGWSSCPAPELSRSWMDNSKRNRTPQGEKGGYFQYVWHHKLINLERLCKGKSCCFSLLISDHRWSTVANTASTSHVQHLFFHLSEQQAGSWNVGMFAGPRSIQGCRSLLGQGQSSPGAILQTPWWTHRGEPPSPVSGWKSYLAAPSLRTKLKSLLLNKAPFT